MANGGQHLLHLVKAAPEAARGLAAEQIERLGYTHLHSNSALQLLGSLDEPDYDSVAAGSARTQPAGGEISVQLNGKAGVVHMDDSSCYSNASTQVVPTVSNPEAAADSGMEQSNAFTESTGRPPAAPAADPAAASAMTRKLLTDFDAIVQAQDLPILVKVAQYRAMQAAAEGQDCSPPSLQTTAVKGIPGAQSNCSLVRTPQHTVRCYMTKIVGQKLPAAVQQEREIEPVECESAAEEAVSMEFDEQLTDNTVSATDKGGKTDSGGVEALSQATAGEACRTEAATACEYCR